MSEPILINQPNLSLAWAQAFLAIRSASGHRLTPLVVTFSGCESGEIIEDLPVRHSLDRALERSGMQTTQTVANTIFPQSLWGVAKGDRQALYDAYTENLPEYVAMEPHKNRGGLYFARLIAFDVDHKTGDRLPYLPKESVLDNGNQLEFIIQHCRPGVRVSMFQASVFDPTRDHTSAAQIGFPCLQHITFVPDFSDRTLHLNAFYATQQLFAKGYGNYLGLARLGMFVGNQLDLALARVTCFIGVEKMENKPHEGRLVQTLISACERALSESLATSNR